MSNFPDVTTCYNWWYKERFDKRSWGHVYSKRSNYPQDVATSFEMHILPVVGKVPIDQIEAHHLAAIVKSMQSKFGDRARRKPLSGKTIIGVASTFKMFVGEIAEVGAPMPDGTHAHLPRVPTFRTVTLPRRSPPPTESVSPAEMPSFLAACTMSPLGGPIALMAVLGLRQQEAERLRWEQLVLDPARYAPAAGVLRYRAEDRKERQDIEVPFPHELLRFLPKRGEDEMIWSVPDGAIARELGKILQAAGIFRHITPHRLRHSAARQMHEVGVSIEDIRAALGHASITTTQGYLRSAHTLERKSQVVAATAARATMGL